MQGREAQRRQIRELMAKVNLAVRQGRLNFSPALDAEIRKQYQRAQPEQGIER